MSPQQVQRIAALALRDAEKVKETGELPEELVILVVVTWGVAVLSKWGPSGPSEGMAEKISVVMMTVVMLSKITMAILMVMTTGSCR